MSQLQYEGAESDSYMSRYSGAGPVSTNAISLRRPCQFTVLLHVSPWRGQWPVRSSETLCGRLKLLGGKFAAGIRLPL
ncbi:Uncharacterised protein [Bordetella pertussis]|nr:Uncharacterised protein [Bordetella pertussis]CFW31809.1 Uncharacterised protein [Bordetella pertussis]CPO75482.1 Uncharacterised protein [Bordetella pertussis]